ncbi:hypothetical protein AALP_AAs41655U000100, partial [Arabis alpina]
RCEGYRGRSIDDRCSRKGSGESSSVYWNQPRWSWWSLWSRWWRESSGGRLNPNRVVPSTPVPTVGVPSTSTGVPSTSTRVPSSSTGVPSSSTGVPSTSTRVPSSSTGVPSSSTGVPSSSTRVPSTSTANRRRGGGGGIPELPLLTGAASGGSTARSDRLVTPTRQPVGPGRETSGGHKSVVDGTSGTGGPSASQRHSLDLNDSPPSRFQGPPLHMTREEPEEEDEQEEEEEEDYYADFAEEHNEVEEEDEVDAPQHGDAVDEDEAP